MMVKRIFPPSIVRTGFGAGPDGPPRVRSVRRVKKGPGVLAQIKVWDFREGTTITIWDSSTASGAKLVEKYYLQRANPYIFLELQFIYGLCISIDGQAQMDVYYV